MNLTGRAPYAKGNRPERVKAMRDAPRDMTCTLALPGCRGGTAHTIGAHLRRFNAAGAAQKPDDVLIVDACDLCHAEQEAGRASDTDILRALMLTLLRRRASGLIHLGKKVLQPGAENATDGVETLGDTE